MKQTCLSIAFAAALPLSCGTDGRPPAPNVLWICVDVLRADHLGCYGYPKPTSPSMDRLAAAGVRFQNAFSQSSWTKPSVPSLFTSLYPRQHQVYEGSTKDREGRIQSDVLDESLTTAAEVFHGAGYATGGFVKNAQLRSYLGFDQGFDVYRDETGDAYEINASFREWYASVEDRPFFAYVHYLDVHWPYRPQDRWRERFAAPSTDLDLTGAGAPLLQDQINDGEVTVSDSDVAAMTALYDASIRQADDAIGDLIAWLDQSGLAERTLVVICADHGEELLEHHVIGHGRSLRDSVLRVPMIFAGPGVAPGRAPTSLVSSIDVLPTLVDLALPARPAGFAPQGRSLAVYLRSARDEPVDQPVFSERVRGLSYQRSVRERAWKLVETYRPVDAVAAGPRWKGRLDLETGERASVRGAFDATGRFVASQLTKVGGGDDVEIRGPIEAVDVDAGTLTVAGFRVRVDDARLKSRDSGERLDWRTLEVGQVVDVDAQSIAPRELQADKMELREDKDAGSRVKLEGPAEEVDPSAPSLRLLGIEVAFEDDAELPGMQAVVPDRPDRDLREATLQDAARYRAKVELFDLRQDPSEGRDVAADHPDVTARLRRTLSEWSRRHEGVASRSARRDLDGDALEELREAGYVR